MTALQIQARIDANAGTRRTVIIALPPGTHYLDRPLRITRSNTTLVGSSFGGTRFDLPNGASVILSAPTPLLSLTLSK